MTIRRKNTANASEAPSDTRTVGAREITERKHAEEALRNSEERFSAIASNTPDHIIMQDRQLRYTFVVNPQLGLTEQDMLGKTDYDFLSREEADRLTQIKTQVLESGQPFHFETSLISKTGGAEIFDGSFIPKRDSTGEVDGLIGYFRNTTERKRAEETLRKSEAHLRAVLDATPFPIALVDTQDNNIIFWSRSALTLFGHAASSATEWYQIAYPDPDYRREVIDRWNPFLEKARLSAQAVNTGEYRIACLDGSVLICEIFAAFVEDNLIVTFNDITERKRAEASVSAAHQQLENIIEFLPDATFVIDQDKRVIAWNRACEILTGVKKEAMLGKGDFAYAEPFFGKRRPILIDLLDQPSPEVEAFYKYIKRVSGTLYAESFIPRLRDGRGAHLWSAASPLFDQEGRRSGAIEVIRDVTEQKHVEDALHESEQKYRELVEHANSIILRWTHDGRITFLNEFGQRFFGYSADEIIGRHVVETIVPTIDTNSRNLLQLMDKILADPIAFEQNVNENIRSNGERVWIAWTNKIVLDAQGQVSEILSVGTDITDLKRAEEAIRELNTSLERRVAERTDELAVARDRAEAADRLKSAFLATMSHELRTPLNSIIGFTGIILQGLAGPLNAEQHKQLEMVRDSARHLLALINDVLDISKIEAGQLEVSSEPFDLRASIGKVAGIVKPLAEKKDLTLQVELAPEIGALVSDPRRVEQVLLNLLNNAIKFTERGVVTLTAEILPGELSAPFSVIHISISDTGIGIKPEDLGKLFQPFRQIDTGLSRQHEGTGLGLAICRRLAELLGGEISAASGWGKGSVFTFTLPLKGPEKNEKRNPSH